MLKEHYIELMNKEIDGIISEKEKKELNKLLLSDFDARKYYDELKETSDILERDNNLSVNPPASLKKSILNSIDHSLYSTSHYHKYIKNSYDATRRILKPKFAAIFASGFVAGIIIFLMIFSNLNINSGNKLDYTGTMGLIDHKNANKISTSTINLKDIKGNINLYNLDNYYWLEIETDADVTYDFQFNYVHPDIYFDNITPLSPTKLQLEHGKNFVKISGASSTHYYLFFKKLTKQSTDISVEIFSGGKSLFNKSFSIN